MITLRDLKESSEKVCTGNSATRGSDLDRDALALSYTDNTDSLQCYLRKIG